LGKLVTFKARGTHTEKTFTPQPNRTNALQAEDIEIQVESDSFGDETLTNFVLMGYSKEEQVFIAACDTMTMLEALELELEMLKVTEMHDWEKKQIKERLEQLGSIIDTMTLQMEAW
jgi:hypothetical protein